MSWSTGRRRALIMLAGIALLSLQGCGAEDAMEGGAEGENLGDKAGCITPTAADQMFGVNLHRLPSGFSGDPNNAAVIDYKNKVVNLETRWVRVLYWNATGNLNRTQMHADLAWARSQGMRVLMIMGGAALANRGFPAYDADDDTWTDYIEAYNAEMDLAMEGFADVVDAWQLFNEPNQGEDRGVMPAHRFGQLTRAVGNHLRSRLPQTTIVSAGLVNWGSGAHDANGVGYLRRALAGGKLPVNVFAFHAYGTLHPDDGGPDHGGHYTLDKMTARFQEQVDAWQFARWEVAHSEVKLWVTEFGGPLDVGHLNGQDVTETYRSDVMRIGYDVWRNNVHRGVERAFYFTMTDFGGIPGQNENLGLLTQSRTPKDAYHAYDALTNESPGCALTALPGPIGGGQTDDGTCNSWGGCGDRSCVMGRCVDNGTGGSGGDGGSGGAGGDGGSGGGQTDDGTCNSWGGCGDRSCVMGRCVDNGTGGAGGDGGTGGGDGQTDDGTCNSWGGCGDRSCVMGRCVDNGTTGGNARQISIRAAAVGTVTMQLHIWDQPVQSWRVQGRNWQTFSFTHNSDIDVSSVKIMLLDDQGASTDLLVESITVGGQTIATRSNGVRSAGTWRSNQCAPAGFYWVDILHCDRGYFEFGQR